MAEKENAPAFTLTQPKQIRGTKNKKKTVQPLET